MRLRLRGLSVLPTGVGEAGFVLGMVFVIFYPLVYALGDGWWLYGWAIVLAAWFRLRYRRRWRLEVLEHSDDVLVVRYERRRKQEGRSPGPPRETSV